MVSSEGPHLFEKPSPSGAGRGSTSDEDVGYDPSFGKSESEWGAP